MKFVSHFILFGFEIFLVDFVGLDDDGDVIHDFDAVGGESDTLGGVVGDESDVCSTITTP